MSGTKACSKEEYEEQAQIQMDEMMALEAILPVSDFSRSKSTSNDSASALLRLSVPAVLTEPTAVLIRSHIYSVPEVVGSNLAHTSGEEETKYRIEEIVLEGISHLPPLELLIRLPREYPTFSAPSILHISGEHLSPSCSEYSNLSKGVDAAKARASSAAATLRASLVQWLRNRLMQQWDSYRGEILYDWYELLKDRIWQEAPLKGPSGIPTFEEFAVEEGQESASKKFESPLAQIIRTFDLVSRRKEFHGERYGCGICLEEKRGDKCFQLSGGCSHIFCLGCLSSYLSTMIREGFIRQASACPDPECVKARVAAENRSDANHMIGQEKIKEEQVGSITEAELLQLVGFELVQRLADLRDKALASTDPLAGYCPRPSCERLVRGDPKDVGTIYESMRSCDCGFIYCLYCKKAWHGKAPCSLVSSVALIEKYQEGSDIVRREMELKYGKSNLERMVKTHEEELANKSYIESNTQQCPCCRQSIEKSVGCNHMTCRSCRTHFCYRCGSRLNPNEPYRHFNTPGTSCYQKLFEYALGGGGGGDGVLGNEDEWALWEAENPL